MRNKRLIPFRQFVSKLNESNSERKDTDVRFRCGISLKEDFDTLCSAMDVTASQYMRTLMRAEVADAKEENAEIFKKRKWTVKR